MWQSPNVLQLLHPRTLELLSEECSALPVTAGYTTNLKDKCGPWTWLKVWACCKRDCGFFFLLSISGQNIPDFSQSNYMSAYSQLSTIDSKVKLLEHSQACVLHVLRNHSTAGLLSYFSDSQKRVMLNEPNMRIIIQVIFGKPTK